VSIPTKVVDAAEAERWIGEGKTYPWIVKAYREKYGVDTSVSMWSSWSRRRGFPQRVVRNKDLIPWNIKAEHANKYLLVMLRAEARRRAGIESTTHNAVAGASFVNRLEQENLVVAYDPCTEEGFYLTPRLPEDNDIIRRPPPELAHKAWRLNHGGGRVWEQGD
jgi:hypothetical protein